LQERHGIKKREEAEIEQEEVKKQEKCNITADTLPCQERKRKKR
jgi:hypothetical protein